MSATDLLTPHAAALVKELEFFARTRVEGFLKSNNRSKRKGQSTEFMQHRQYMPGDDLRSLDWRVFARSDRLVTREYEEYTNLDVVIGLDASGSMGYGTLELNKIEFCRRCAAMICYLLLGQRDAFGLTILRDRVAQYLRPQSSRKHLVEVLRQLVEAQPTGLTDFAVGGGAVVEPGPTPVRFCLLLRLLPGSGPAYEGAGDAGGPRPRCGALPGIRSG